MRKCLYAIAALTLAAAIAGCGSGSSGSTNAASHGGSGSSKHYAELRWGSLVWPGVLNTRTVGWSPTFMIESLVVQHLVEFEPNGKLKLGLASSIEHPNATTYIYHIKPGVKFSDGQPLTTSDVVYSLDQNLEKIATTNAFWSPLVASVAATGKSTVVIKLKKPDVDWPSILAYSSQILEKAAAEKAGGLKALGTPQHLPIGTGPWKFDTYTPDARVELSRNRYWTGPAQPASKISFVLFKEEAAMSLALRSGAIDGAMDYENQKLFAEIPGSRQLDSAPNWLDFLSVNVTKAPFNNVHVRRAIAYATNINGMLKALFPAGDAVRPASIVPTPGFTEIGASETQIKSMLSTVPQYEFDLAAAQRELAKSPYPHGFTTEIAACVVEPLLVQAAQILATDLAKVGIKAKVNAFPTDAFPSMYGNKIKIFLNEGAVFFPEPDQVLTELLSPAFMTVAGANTSSYSNAEVTKLLPAELEIANPASRLQLVGRILKRAGAELPYLPMFSHANFATLSNKYVEPTWSLYSSFYTPWALNVKLAS
ncbi:MAG TPA: ABC transporter substrate-binding protein [Solirubrobacteraceae bacterium]|jgi:peptide/nickel transport system substrate-binding protein|nr:ABC transporter substrate-binding protein [Solirubrobacteraceae bacterium]